MEIKLTDEEVKHAIRDYLNKKVLLLTIPPPPDGAKIRREYYNEGSGFEAVIEWPDAPLK